MTWSSDTALKLVYLSLCVLLTLAWVYVPA
jgi:hypothetical protein